MDLENKTPYLSLSFQQYRWKESLLSCLLQWVDRVLPPRIETGRCSNANAREFLQLLSQNHACPFRSNYSSVFAFSSERCFLAEAVRWMLPTLAAKVPSMSWVGALLCYASNFIDMVYSTDMQGLVEPSIPFDLWFILYRSGFPSSG